MITTRRCLWVSHAAFRRRSSITPGFAQQLLPSPRGLSQVELARILPEGTDVQVCLTLSWQRRSQTEGCRSGEGTFYSSLSTLVTKRCKSLFACWWFLFSFFDWRTSNDFWFIKFKKKFQTKATGKFCSKEGVYLFMRERCCCWSSFSAMAI